MDQEVMKKLGKDRTGLSTYEYIANHIGELSGDDMRLLVDNMLIADATGQFDVSTARYLHAINPALYAESIDRLIKGAIERDREHKYIGDLLSAIWGADYAEHVDELVAKDDNFRRIYKRMFAVGM